MYYGTSPRIHELVPSVTLEEGSGHRHKQTCSAVNYCVSVHRLGCHKARLPVILSYLCAFICPSTFYHVRTQYKSLTRSCHNGLETCDLTNHEQNKILLFYPFHLFCWGDGKWPEIPSSWLLRFDISGCEGCIKSRQFHLKCLCIPLVFPIVSSKFRSRCLLPKCQDILLGLSTIIHILLSEVESAPLPKVVLNKPIMTNSNKVLLETVWNLNWLLWEFLYLFYYGGYVCAHNVEGTYVCHGRCDEDNGKLCTVGHLLHFCGSRDGM